MFSVTYETFSLPDDPGADRLISEARTLKQIESTESFNKYCRGMCRLWQKNFPEGKGGTSSKFIDLQKRIADGGENIIQTSWGGVVVTRHEPPEVEKYLVVRKNGYLALEKHEEKNEFLEVMEGAGCILLRKEPGETLAAEQLLPGKHFHLSPGQEHCVIGTENLLILERSIDPKGMDQDLIFIFTPD